MDQEDPEIQILHGQEEESTSSADGSDQRMKLVVALWCKIQQMQDQVEERRFVTQ